ncbi:MAG: peptide chain release factor N(5)-glutamine methyltransferase [Candidatus Kapabacteria bacterium]|nr:peptide chain release factor N(5)-glutamine methyltransferase [Candidatus Kapabacteria bacterium]
MPRNIPVIDRVWTILDLIRWGAEYFRDKEIDSPRLTIELMICHVLDIQRVQLYTDFERPLTREELANLRAMVLRRKDHEPLQYILGQADFYGRPFIVTPDVLIPRPETELLVDRVIRGAKGQGSIRCLDIGTGSGCIPVTAAIHLPESHWLAIDISKGALDVATRNAERHGVADRVELQQCDILKEQPAGTFDIITMNPPYIAAADISELEPEVRDHEPHQALTDDADGLTFFRRLAVLASVMLRPGGTMFIEIGHGQSELVRSILASAAMKTEIIPDLAMVPRIAIVRNSPSMS